MKPARQHDRRPRERTDRGDTSARDVEALTTAAAAARGRRHELTLELGQLGFEQALRPSIHPAAVMGTHEMLVGGLKGQRDACARCRQALFLRRSAMV